MRTAVLNSINQAGVLVGEVNAILATGNDVVIKPSKCNQYFYLSAGKAKLEYESTVALTSKDLLLAINKHVCSGKVTVTTTGNHYEVRGICHE